MFYNEIILVKAALEEIDLSGWDLGLKIGPYITEPQGFPRIKIFSVNQGNSNRHELMENRDSF